MSERTIREYQETVTKQETVKHCDGCGGDEPKSGWVPKIKSGHSWASPGYSCEIEIIEQFYCPSGGDGQRQNLDLCPECLASFRSWIEARRAGRKLAPLPAPTLNDW